MIISTLLRIYRQWKRYNASVMELDRLGDRELADLGIKRSDVHRLAWENSRI